jgi:polyhydroxyalkanoate synthesis regulator phasin
MAQNDLMKRLLDAGLQFTQMTQRRAEELVADLVKAGEVQAEQAQTFVAELYDRSRKNSEELVERVRAEVRQQVAALDLVTRDVVNRLEQQVEAIRQQLPASGGRRTAGATSTKAVTATKAAASSTASAARKASGGAKRAASTATKSASAKKTSAKKTTAKKTPARKTPATKTTARKATAKKSARSA